MSIFAAPMVQEELSPPPLPPYPMHECGVFGVFGHPNAAVLTYYGLFALQHRGQESAGIVTSNGPGRRFCSIATWGSSRRSSARKNWPGSRARGRRPHALFHHRLEHGEERAAARGRLLPRPDRHRAQRQPDQRRRPARRTGTQGSIFQTTVDSEIILHLLAQPSNNGGNILTALRRIEGAFSLVLMSEREIIGGARSVRLPPACR